MDEAALRAPGEKAAMRRRLRAERARRNPAALLEAGAAIGHLAAAVLQLPSAGGSAAVAAFAAVRDEPPTRPLLDALTGLGRSVLLPVLAAPRLDWARYDGWAALVDSGGLLEPAGPRLGTAALAEAGIVVVPALAVDRDGNRLGRGGGHYDRALAGVPRDRIVAVVFSDELVDAVPTEAHDIRVGAALTPAGIVSLPAQDDGS